ncbi:MAG: radical SAM protein, partial [Bacteroidetes bacterium HGW-Bacteroidetes-12]
SQYHPNRDALTSNGRINRVITASEYNDVVNKLNELGFYRGWLQDLDSNNQYLPDFSKEEPFF